MEIMNMLLKSLIFVLTTVLQESSALNCTECTGRGLACIGKNKGKEVECQVGENRCGREWLLNNHTYHFHQGCVNKDLCVGSIDCNKDGFKLGKVYKNGTRCVVTCCDGHNCTHNFPFYCYECRAKGDRCFEGSTACGYGEDRCLRVNFEVGGELMTDQRCYQASRCSNTSEICSLVKKDHPTASQCKHVCCQDLHNCGHPTDPTKTDNPTSSSYIGYTKTDNPTSSSYIGYTKTDNPTSSSYIVASCVGFIFFLVLIASVMQGE